jgi:hypothetical protein
LGLLNQISVMLLLGNSILPKIQQILFSQHYAVGSAA